MNRKTVPDFWFEPGAWVDGQWQSGGDTFAVHNPATGETLANVVRTDAAATQRAVEGAAKVFHSWRETPAATRGEVLKRAAALLLERKDAFGRLLSAEQGKPYAQAVGEVGSAASFYQWFGEEARRVSGRLAPHPAPGREFFVEVRPVGVAGLITPWNFPIAQGAKKVAAALAAGCTAVWKPAELTPLIALAIAPLFREAGLPAGVLQIVPGSGSVVGGVLADHPAVRVLSLTGSTATGSTLMARGAKGIKRCSLELGGNAPFIVLPDADLDFTAEELVRSKLFVSGQVCVTANRVFVHADVEKAFTEKVATRLSAARVGNGLDEGVDAGPLIHQKACEDVGSLVARARGDGARVVCENRSFERDPSLKAGSFSPVTLLADVRDDMAVAREEIFGPVISLLRYQSLDEVVRRANETPFGLSAYVYGRDLARCRAVASRLEVGIVGVNEWRPLKAEIPFGGVKMSGLGAEGGLEGIREFLDAQVHFDAEAHAGAKPLMASKRLRSESWWNDPANPGMTALYLERFLNYGLTPGELQSGRPVIGIAQSANDLAPCNRIHLQTVTRICDGIRDAGGVPMVFPMHPLQESVRRPTAALDRNLAYLGLVEILHGYPLDGVVFTTGCDKTTPAALMAAVTTDLPALVLNGGPMLSGYLDGEPAGNGVIVWEARRRLAAGIIDEKKFTALLAASAPSAGHCNVMGTALSMNCLAEAMGMALPGSAAIPAPYRERGQAAHAAGRRIVEMVREDLRPTKVITRQSLLNAIRVNTALGGSTNCPPHLIAIARHAGVDLQLQDWETFGYDLPLLVNLQPAGQHLGEDFHRAGSVPVVMRELLRHGLLDGDAFTVTGQTIAQNVADAPTPDGDVIRPLKSALREKAGFLVLTGNLFEAALIKTSVISADFRRRYLSKPGSEDCFECRAVVFDGPEDYHARVNDPALAMDENTMLVVRGCGVIGFPGAGEIVNMQPPDALLRAGINELPTLGDGRQSGTSASPSILNASPESYAGGGLARLRTGDRIRVDLRVRRVDALVPEDEWQRRSLDQAPELPAPATPWQQLYRAHAGQLHTGGCLEFACDYRNVCAQVPRHNH